MNNITIHGRLTRDPELKTYTNKKNENGSLCNITVAVDRPFGEETDFFDCTCYGKLAEVIDRHFAKGREIVLSGSMQCHKYVAKDGTNRYPWVLVFDRFDFCGKKSDADSGSGSSAPAASQDNIPPDFEKLEDDDIPF